jgi:hypothetical protein
MFVVLVLCLCAVLYLLGLSAALLMARRRRKERLRADGRYWRNRRRGRRFAWHMFFNREQVLRITDQTVERGRL